MSPPDQPDLSRLSVPEHRTGFWEDVETELVSIGAQHGAAMEGLRSDVVELRSPEVEAAGRPPWVVASAAAAIVLLLGGATALLTRPTNDGVETVAAGLVGTSVATSEAASGDAAPVATTAPAITDGGRAPWYGSRLRLDQVAAELPEEWAVAENQRWCSALAPSTLASIGNDATARAADFEGGWAVAWDKSDGPGQNPDGTDCADCGRSSFGIAGTGTTHDTARGRSEVASITWSDGSYVHLGPEAGDGTKWIADLVVAGQGCRYQVWSNSGEEHLVRLVGTLRFVEDLVAPPVELRTAADRPEVVVLGQPPWAGSSLEAEEVAAIVTEKWDELSVDGPRLMLAGLGDEVSDAAVRTWGGGVAWDRTSGPGHDAFNRPCADCGRGVVGVGWQVAGDDAAAGIPPPHRIEWSDGSYAEYGGRIANPALPRDRVLFFDPETGEPTVDALQAVVHADGSTHDVIVWSHLGEDHLLYLIEQLRWVEEG